MCCADSESDCCVTDTGLVAGVASACVASLFAAGFAGLYYRRRMRFVPVAMPVSGGRGEAPLFPGGSLREARRGARVGPNIYGTCVAGPIISSTNHTVMCDSTQ